MSPLFSLQLASEPPSPLTNGFLLVEPGTIYHEPFLQTLSMHPCTPRALAHREELMPRLIEVASLAPEAQAQVSHMLLQETATDRPPVVCAWLACDAGIEDLALHVARYLVGPGTDGGLVFWRFYDPRVLALILTVFDPAQRSALLGPITEWQFAWAGHRWTVTGPGTLNDESEGCEPAWPKADQWPRINHSEAAARVIERLPAMAPDEATQRLNELDRMFNAAVGRGGMLDTDTLADYAWHCVRYGQAFEQHPLLLDAWPALSRREIHWSDVLARFTPADLQAFETASRPLRT